MPAAALVLCIGYDICLPASLLQNCLYGRLSSSYLHLVALDSEAMPMTPPCCIASSFRGLLRL
jgi:hypothetical protein